MLSRRFSQSFRNFLVAVFSIVSIHPKVANFIFEHFCGFVLSLRSSLEFGLSFPDIFVLVMSVLVMPVW